MDDKCLMEGLLLLEKGVCDLYMHGTIESPSGNVHRVFDSALKESLGIQDNIYSSMEKRGWYSPEQAEQTKVESVKTKFSTAVPA
ncbi:MAG: spore coat protein [Oscillospiraceae bacterium]|nr:spore coat protein [Oscillospiraceae bacterium]